MRKLLLFMSLLLAANVAKAIETTFVVNGLGYYVYDYNSNFVSVVPYDINPSGQPGFHITIPSYVEHNNEVYTVKRIRSFKGPRFDGITIPATVDTIDNRAFENARFLQTIIIEDGDTPLKMSDQGFYNPFYGSDTTKTVYIGRNFADYVDYAPFSNTTKVTFGDKVTRINPYLFLNIDTLSTVIIGSGVTDIGAYAFQSSGDAEGVGTMTVEMGPNVKHIGQHAFDDCNKLRSITLPEVLTQIDGNAFGSTGLTSLTIPVSVDSIGDRAFEYCSDLASITINETTKPLKMTNYGFYCPFYGSDAAKVVKIGRNLAEDVEYAPFGNTTKVTFGDKVTRINPYLFLNIDTLSTVIIGSGVTDIGAYAFQSSGDAEGVGTMTVEMGPNVKHIGQHAFDDCNKLRSITLPEVLTQIDGNAFGTTGLTSLTIPVSVDSIGDRAFEYCSDLASITINETTKPLKMTEYGFYCPFYGSSAAKVVKIGRNLAEDVEYAPFGNTTKVTFGDKVTYINPYLFQNIDTLSTVVIGSGVTDIGAYAFQSSGDAEGVGTMTVEMGPNVKHIGQYAFGGCNKLRSITLPEVLTQIDGNAFGTTGLTSLTIPVSVDSIGDRAFEYCSDLASITINETTKPLKMTDAGFYCPFYGSDAAKVVKIGRNLAEDVEYAPFGYTTKAIIGDLVTYINPYLFYDIDTLSYVKIGDGVGIIGHDAFRGSGDAEGVGTMTVEMGKNVTHIEAFAFQRCSSLKAINLPGTMKNIDGTAFGSTGLGEISLPAALDSIGDRAFEHCKNLTRVRMEDGDALLKMTSTDFYQPFYGCEAVKMAYAGRPLDVDYELFSKMNAVEFGEPATRATVRCFRQQPLQTVTAHWATPPDLMNDVFFTQSVYDNATLFVPFGTKNAYMATSGWREFFHIIEYADTDGIEAIPEAADDDLYGDGSNGSDARATYFDMDGRKLSGKPTAKGIYIVGGKKVLVK